MGTDYSKYPKDLANLVEAWIGAIIRERLLFDENDFLEELNEFFSRLWRRRYRSLNEYFLGVPEAGRNINLEKVEILEEKRVTVPGDDTTASVIGIPSAPARTIGFQVTARITSESSTNAIPSEGFATTVEEARKLAMQSALNGESSFHYADD